MKSCVFFGNREINFEQYREKLLQILTDLIENEGVTQFYSGFRGNFDRYCSGLVHELKARYPHVKNTMVWSYIPTKEYSVPTCFDDSVYILERRVPQQFAIIETNKRLVDKVDFVVAGVLLRGGACTACEYAYKRKKPIINVIDGNEIYKNV